MKRNIFIVVILASIILGCAILWTQGMQSYALPEQKEIAWQEKYKELDFDLYGSNMIVFTEEEVNGIVLGVLESTWPGGKINDEVTLNGFYVQCEEQGLRILANVEWKGLSFGVSALAKVQMVEEQLTITLEDGHLGEVKIPDAILERLGLQQWEFEHRYFTSITLESLVYRKGEVEGNIHLNMEAIVGFFVPAERQEGVLEVLSIIGKSESGISFANHLLDLIILDSLGMDIGLNNILQSVTKFSDISFQDKMSLVLALNKLLMN